MPLVKPRCVICGASPEDAELAAERLTLLPVCFDPIDCVSRFTLALKSVEDAREQPRSPSNEGEAF